MSAVEASFLVVPLLLWLAAGISGMVMIGKLRGASPPDLDAYWTDPRLRPGFFRTLFLAVPAFVIFVIGRLLFPA